MRAERRLDPLPNDVGSLQAPGAATDPQRTRWVAAMQRALHDAVARLDPRQRLRLGCYYVQELTLAEIGRVMRESEATASRQLARTRRALRQDIESELEATGMDAAEIRDCVASLADDAGTLDLKRMLEGRAVTTEDTR